MAKAREKRDEHYWRTQIAGLRARVEKAKAERRRAGSPSCGDRRRRADRDKGARTRGRYGRRLTNSSAILDT